MTNEPYGWEQTKTIWRDRDTRFLYRILGGALLIDFGVLIGWGLFAEKCVKCFPDGVCDRFAGAATCRAKS
jgi:hypothetical protein